MQRHGSCEGSRRMGGAQARTILNLKKGTVLLLPDGRPTTNEFSIEAILRQHPSNGRTSSKRAAYCATTTRARTKYH